MRILFTGAGRRIELLQAFREAALTLKKELTIYGADMTYTAPALAYCDYIRKVVAMRDPNYISDLLSICREDKIDLLIPTIDTDLLLLSENRERFEEEGIKVMISAPEMIRVCRDKNNTAKFFMDCGLMAPVTVNNLNEYKFGYPAFIKPKDGSSSIDAYKVDNEEELKVYAEHIGDYIIQPFVSGREYTIDIFCDWEGTPISIVPRERLQVRQGEVLKTRITLDEKMIEEARAICAGFKPCGPLTVQLIRDEKGTDWFIEINPRFGGGAPLSMKAGARSAEAILKLISNEEVNYCTDIADEAVYSRFDQSVSVQDGHNDIKGVIFDLDDTLYGEKEYVKSGYKAVSEYLGGDYTKRLWQLFEEGKPAIDELLTEIGRESERERALDAYRNHVPDIEPYEGVREMLDYLRSCDIKIGIITDGRPEGQHNKVNALDLGIDDVIITDELGSTQFRKPCDIAFRIMQTRWRLPSPQIVYVGDNPKKDFMAPHQLGMKCIYFRNKDGLYSEDTEVQIETIDSITDCKDIIMRK